MFVSDLHIRALANSHALFALLVCVQLIGREREFARKISFYIIVGLLRILKPFSFPCFCRIVPPTDIFSASLIRVFCFDFAFT